MVRRPRVVLLNLTRQWGATEREVLWLAEALAKGDVVRPILAAHPEGQLYHYARLRGVPAFTVESKGGWEPFVTRRFASALRAEDPALVHAFSAQAAGLAAAAISSRRVALVVSIHPADEAAPSSRVRRAIREASAVMVPTERARQAIIAATEADPDRVGVVAPLIDVSIAAASPPAELYRSLGIPVGAPIASFVGALAPGEDPLSFVRALADARRWVPALIGVMIGEGALREAVVAEAERLGVSSALVVAAAGEDAAAILPAASVHVACGVDVMRTEPMLRAFVSGVPVVATQTPGVDALITDQESGLLAPPGNPSVLANAMAHLLTDEMLRGHCVAGARRRATDYLLERASVRTQAIYRAVLGLSHQASESSDNHRTRAPLNPIVIGDTAPRERSLTSRLPLDEDEIVLHPSQAIA
jgi:glycosyltransferase involved in cell wall biosynthesis